MDVLNPVSPGRATWSPLLSGIISGLTLDLDLLPPPQLLPWATPKFFHGPKPGSIWFPPDAGPLFAESRNQLGKT